MAPESIYETATMARVYARQGYLRQAAGIYRRLLERNPRRSDLSAELDAVERRIAARRAPGTRELGLLVKEWAELVERRKMRSGR
jgi:hypothetical protein